MSTELAWMMLTVFGLAQAPAACVMPTFARTVTSRGTCSTELQSTTQYPDLAADSVNGHILQMPSRLARRKLTQVNSEAQ